MAGRPKTSTRTRAAALVVSAIVVLAGCVAPYTGNVKGPRVAVIGDSITRLAEPALGLLYMASKFPHACIVFATLSTHTASSQMNEFAAELNHGIRLGSNYVDWDALAEDPRTTYDTLHLTPYGAELLASETRTAVLRCAR